MKTANSMSWKNPQDVEFLKNNLDRGYPFLSKHFGCSEMACRRKAQKLGITVNRSKREKDIKDGKVNQKLSSTSEKFNPKKHKILNSDIKGKIPLYIPSQRMTVYITEDQNPQDIISKYENRKNNW